MQPFEIKEPRQQNIFEKVLGKKKRQNAIVDINNLLAEKGVENVNDDDILAIADQYNFHFSKKYKNQLEEIYGNYLIYCLEDNHLSNEEIHHLQHLKRLLRLNDKDVNEIHEHIAGRIYQTEIDKVLDDRRLDEHERTFLEKLQNDLMLPEKYARQLYHNKSKNLMNQYLNDAFSDERLTPDEEEELLAISKNLGLEIPDDQYTQNKLNKYRLFWQIENGEMPEVPIDVDLSDEEECYFYTKVEWMEAREGNKRIKSNDNKMHFRENNAACFQAGALGGYPVTDDVLITVDEGDLYITNKRIMLNGKKQYHDLTLSKVKNFAVYTNGVDIITKGEKNPFLHFKESSDIMALVLKRLLNIQ